MERDEIRHGDRVNCEVCPQLHLYVTPKDPRRTPGFWKSDIDGCQNCFWGNLIALQMEYIVLTLTSTHRKAVYERNKNKTKMK